MPLIAYREQRFNGKARKTVEQAKLILAEYDEAGYVLTLRQLYYQFVSRNLIANTEKEYKRLGRIITDAREVGEIDWYAIEDRGRQCLLHGHEDDPRNVLKGIERVIRLNPWRDQDVYLESWVEKSALEGVISRPANRWRSPYMACKGYLSASEAWRAGRRFEKAIAEGKRPVLIHLGDHDPSGIDMTRDNGTRLALFARMGVEVVRVALNMDQVEQYGPPPNPAKQQDSRFEGYQTLHGNESWELDALQPQVIDQLVSDQIESYIDKDKWAATLAREQELRKPLMNLAHRYDEIVRLSLSGEMPLERLARLDPLVKELVGPGAETRAGLLDRLGQRCMVEGMYASAQMRVRAIELVDGLAVDKPEKDDVPGTGKAERYFDAGADAMLVEVKRAIAKMPDAPPSEKARDLRDDASDMIDRLQTANEPTPAPDRPEGDDEPDDTEADPDDVDAVEKDLYGPEED